MTTIRPATEDDLERILRLEAQAFNIPTAVNERRRARTIAAQVRVAERDGTIAATTRRLPIGHFFGGRAVEAAGISAVAVAADARGSGIGSELMTTVLTELRAEGVPISSLYPATVPIYRKHGYGYGGVRSSWKVQLSSVANERGARVEEFDASAIEDLDAAYRAIAAQTNGLVVRTQDWWEHKVLEVEDPDPRYRYLVREGGEVTGWIVYSLQSSKDSWRSTVACRDLFWRTADAARALLGLAALHRSTSERITWTGPPVDLLADLTAEDVAQHDGAFRWMIRLLDVPAAIEARGYPALVEAEVAVEVADPLFDGNAGPWRIQVRDGAAKVAPAERAEVRTDVQTLASIWSSLLAPRDAVRLGTLTGSERALDALTLMFGGPAPWIADFY